jgi:hypothetical protein
LQTIDTLPGKQAELLLELLPQASNIGVLVNPANRAHPGILRDIESAVRGSTIRMTPVEVRTPLDFDGVFRPPSQSRIDG